LGGQTGVSTLSCFASSAFNRRQLGPLRTVRLLPSLLRNCDREAGAGAGQTLLVEHDRELVGAPRDLASVRFIPVHILESSPGTTIADLRAVIVHLRAVLADVRAVIVHLRAVLADVRAVIVHLRAVLADVRAVIVYLRAVIADVRAVIVVVRAVIAAVHTMK
jgi:hypothetical protein